MLLLFKIINLWYFMDPGYYGIMVLWTLGQSNTSPYLYLDLYFLVHYLYNSERIFENYRLVYVLWFPVLSWTAFNYCDYR